MRYTALDLFCGAGGFSEGILQAGFEILFSSDISPMVKETYTNRHKQLGIIEGVDTHFELADINDLTKEKIFNSINSLKYGDKFKQGDIDVIFGGPPCQGFSRLGKRNSSDPRNKLFHEYLRIIRDVKPKYVVMENVTGILDMYMLDFPTVLNDEKKYDGQNLVNDILKEEFTGLGYTLLDVQVLNAANYGVPQQRNRVVYLAYRNDVTPINYPEPTSEYVTVHDALGDLYEGEYNYSTDYSLASKLGRTNSLKTNKPIMSERVRNMEKSTHEQSVIERFSLYEAGENRYKAVERYRLNSLDLMNRAPTLFYESLFQLNSDYNKKLLENFLSRDLDNRWMNFTNKYLSSLYQYEKVGNSADFKNTVKKLSKRLNITEFEAHGLWKEIRPYLNNYISEKDYIEKLIHHDFSDEIVEAIFTKKGVRSRLNPKTVSPTMVTLPDDYIHPYFNRILTVREMARLQSFDDSFEFLGKRTTGGSKRAQEVPQFTQVGNAVPPLLAKRIATEVKIALEATYKNKVE